MIVKHHLIYRCRVLLEEMFVSGLIAIKIFNFIPLKNDIDLTSFQNIFILIENKLS